MAEKPQNWWYHTERMLMGIPTSEAKVETADEGHLIVDNEELLVMCPVERHVGCVFENVVVRVSHDFDVSVARAPLGAQRL